MRFLVVVILIIVQSQLSAATRECCHPDRVMGTAFLVEKQEEWIFAVDFMAGRFYHKPDNTQDCFTIEEFMGNRRISERDGRWGTSPFVQCLTDGHHVGTFSLASGGQGSSIDVFKYMVSGQAVWKYVNIQDGKCVPVILQKQDQGINQTFIYSNIKPNFDFNDILVSNDCKDMGKGTDGKY